MLIRVKWSELSFVSWACCHSSITWSRAAAERAMMSWKNHSGSCISKREQFTRISITLVLINRFMSSLVIWKVQSLLFPLLRESCEKILFRTSTAEQNASQVFCIKTFDTKQGLYQNFWYKTRNTRYLKITTSAYWFIFLNTTWWRFSVILVHFPQQEKILAPNHSIPARKAVLGALTQAGIR